MYEPVVRGRSFGGNASVDVQDLAGAVSRASLARARRRRARAGRLGRGPQRLRHRTRRPGRGAPDRRRGRSALRRSGRRRERGGLTMVTRDRGAGVPRPPTSGVWVAGVTALVSGVSVFVNSYGVRAVASPAVYTTAKNLVAALVLVLAAYVGVRMRRVRKGSFGANFVTRSIERRLARARLAWLALAYVGVIGGGLAFVLFFDGLAQSEPASAAFWRDTLVLWVALLAVVFLRERVRWWNVAAIAAAAGRRDHGHGWRGSAWARIAASCSSWRRACCGPSRWWWRAACCGPSHRRRWHSCAWAWVRWPCSRTCALSGAISQLTTLDAHQLTWALLVRSPARRVRGDLDDGARAGTRTRRHRRCWWRARWSRGSCNCSPAPSRRRLLRSASC